MVVSINKDDDGIFETLLVDDGRFLGLFIFVYVVELGMTNVITCIIWIVAQ